MLFNVPQFIDIEDKIVGPLTAKQLGWLAAGGVLILIFWATLESSSFFVAAFFTGLITGAFAFYKPYNQPLIKFVSSSFSFVFRPKVYVWKRYYDTIRIKHSKFRPQDKTPKRKTLDSRKVYEISEILDNQNR